MELIESVQAFYEFGEPALVRTMEGCNFQPGSIRVFKVVRVSGKDCHHLGFAPDGLLIHRAFDIKIVGGTGFQHIIRTDIKTAC